MTTLHEAVKKHLEKAVDETAAKTVKSPFIKLGLERTGKALVKGYSDEYLITGFSSEKEIQQLQKYVGIKIGNNILVSIGETIERRDGLACEFSLETDTPKLNVSRTELNKLLIEAVRAWEKSVRKHLEKATVETAALISMSLKPLTTSEVAHIIKLLKKEGGYTVTKKSADKGSWIITVSAKTRRGFEESVAKKLMTAEINRLVREAKQNAKESKPTAAKKPSATPAPSADAATKAPRGTGKLKSFLKENNIDLKTLKTMIKFVK